MNVMEMIGVPLIVWICVSGVYGLFELYARRKERLVIIERMGDKLDSSLLDRQFSGMNFAIKSFSSLKIGCLLIGLGLGLLVGLWIHAAILSNSYYTNMDSWRIRDLAGVAYGASVLLFGGIGLLVSFLIETKMDKKGL